MKIIVYFSDGTTKTFYENQQFMVISKGLEPIISTERFLPKRKGVVTLTKTKSAGLVPSFLEVLINADFFFALDEPNIYYNSNSIFKFEKLDN